MKMSSLTARLILLAMALQPALVTARDQPYYGYDDQGYDNDHHSSDSEKAVAAAVVGALAIAAAKNVDKQQHKEEATEQLREQLHYRNQSDTVVVWITTYQGKKVPIYLKRSGKGYVGPRGEFYPSLPTSWQLGQGYGANAPANYNTDRNDRDDDRNYSPDVVVRQGKVMVTRGNRTLCAVRPAMANVERTKLVNGDRQLVVKSRGNHGPATVELFNVSDGSLSDKVMAFAIRGGQLRWAAGMAD